MENNIRRSNESLVTQRKQGTSQNQVSGINNKNKIKDD